MVKYLSSFLSTIVVSLSILFISTLFSGCLRNQGPNGDDILNPNYISNFNFELGKFDWQGGYADYMVGAEDSLFYSFGLVTPPSGLFVDSLLRIAGMDHSKNLFLFIKTKVDGLDPNTTYRIDIAIDLFAQNLGPADHPEAEEGDELSYLKVGAITREPKVIKTLDEATGLEWYEMDIDKGSYKESGDEMVVLGAIPKYNPGRFTDRLKAVNNEDPISVTSNDEGEIWLIVGTESQRGLRQAYYYHSVLVYYTEM